MKKIAIMTDSTCCLPQELLDQYGIHVVPLYVHFDDKVYRDGVDLTPDEFYDLLRKAKNLPTTSTPSVGDLSEAYRKLGQSTEAIMCIFISAVYSTTVEAGNVAKDMLKESFPKTDVEVIDSRATGGALGFIALEAARAASQGSNMAKVAAKAKEMIPKVSMIAALDTLFYLSKGGRIGTASAWAGAMLRIKPLIEVTTTTGNTEALEQTRTKRRAVERLLEIVKERVGQAPLHAIVHHAGAPDEGEALKAEVAARFNCAELYLTPFTPVMGAHTGPCTVGISFYAED